MKRAALLYNPVSGTGRAGAAATRAEAALRAAGWQVERLETTRPGHAETLARDCAASIDRLVVAGGDGSIREALTGLGEEARRVAVAVVPCGNANVVARELGIPLDPAAALALLEADAEDSEVRRVDLARANGSLFLAMVGLGWDARTVHGLARLRQTRVGAAWYRLWADSLWFVAGLLALFVWRRERLQLEVDGVALPRHYCAAVLANFRCYGKGWSMVPDARPDSGALHYQARKRFGVPFVVCQLLAAVFARRTPAFVSDHGAGRRIRVQATRNFGVQIDGDPAGTTRDLVVEIEPAAACFVVPRPRAGL